MEKTEMGKFDILLRDNATIKDKLLRAGVEKEDDLPGYGDEILWRELCTTYGVTFAEKAKIRKTIEPSAQPQAIIPTTFRVSYIDGSESPVIEDTSCSLSGLVARIRDHWNSKPRYQNFNIFVRGYNGGTPIKPFPLDTLVKEFGRIGNLSNAVETFLQLPVKIFEYGAGISSIKAKTAFLELNVFTCDNFNDNLVDSVKYIKKVATDAFHLVINDQLNPSISIRINKTVELFQASWHKNFFSVFYLPLHASYSVLNFAQLQHRVFFQQSINGDVGSMEIFTEDMKKAPKGHHEMLTTLPDQLQTPITEAREMLSKKPEHSQIYEDAKKTAKMMLGIISKNTMPKREYNEKSRRTVIDIVIYSALEVVNRIFLESQPREILVEEGLFNDKDRGISELPAEIIGSGPLDYSVPEGVIISAQSIDEGKETIVEDDENMEEESSGNKVSSFTDIVAKTDLNDDALYQLLGQIHDALYVKVEAQGQKRKLEADIESGGTIRVKLNREKVIGILSTGHRAEVFSIRVDPDTLRKIVTFHGRRTLKVLRYLESTLRTSSFKVKDWNVEVSIHDSELDEMLLLFIAVFLNLV